MCVCIRNGVALFDDYEPEKGKGVQFLYSFQVLLLFCQ